MPESKPAERTSARMTFDEFWGKAFERMTAMVPEMTPPDMAAVSMSVCKIDVSAPRTAFFRAMLEAAERSTCFVAKDLTHLAVAYSHVPQKTVFHDFMRRIVVPALETAAAHDEDHLEGEGAGAVRSDHSEVGEQDLIHDHTVFELDANMCSRLLTALARLDARSGVAISEGTVRYLEKQSCAWQSELFPREIATLALAFSKVGQSEAGTTSGQ